MALHSEVLWAQRSSATDDKQNFLHLTIPLDDVLEDTLELNIDPRRLSFSAKADRAEADRKEYAFTIDLLFLFKKEKQAEYWPRLTKDKGRSPYIKVDYDKGVDEDDQGEAQELDSGFDDAFGSSGLAEGLSLDGKILAGFGDVNGLQ